MAEGWLRGVAYSVAASVIGAASKLCLRKSYTVLAKSRSKSEASWIDCDGHDCLTILKSWAYRLLGVFGMTTLNPYCCVISLKYASPSILAPFSGLTLVFIVLLSEATLGEKPSSSQAIAAGLIILGQIVIAIFGDHTNTEVLDIDQVRQAYMEPEFISYIIGMFGWLFLLGGMICFGSTTDNRVAWGLVGGSVTGVQPFIKDALAVVTGLRIDRIPISDYPREIFVLFLLSAVIPLVGLALLMGCMKRYDATYSSSMFVGSMIMSVSVMSAVRYKTFEHIDCMWSATMYVFGLCVLVGGTVILACEDVTTSPQQPSPMEDNSSTQGSVFEKKKLIRTGSSLTYGTIEEVSDDQLSDSSSSATVVELPRR